MQFMNKLIISKEEPNEIQQIWEVNSLAFETDAEANLVIRLLNSGIEHISLVAKYNNNVVGHT